LTKFEKTPGLEIPISERFSVLSEWLLSVVIISGLFQISKFQIFEQASKNDYSVSIPTTVYITQNLSSRTCLTIL